MTGLSVQCCDVHRGPFTNRPVHRRPSVHIWRSSDPSSRKRCRFTSNLREDFELDIRLRYKASGMSTSSCRRWQCSFQKSTSPLAFASARSVLARWFGRYLSGRNIRELWSLCRSQSLLGHIPHDQNAEEQPKHDAEPDRILSTKPHFPRCSNHYATEKAPVSLDRLPVYHPR